MSSPAPQKNGTNDSTTGLPRASHRKWSTSLRLLGLLILVSLGVSLVIWIKVRTWSQLRVLEEEFAAIQTERFYVGVNVRSTIWQLNGALLRYQLSKADYERERFLSDSRKLKQTIQAALPRLTTAEERQLANQLDQAYQQYLADTSHLVETRPGAVRKNTSAQVHAAILTASKPALDVSDRLVRAQDAALAGFFEESEWSLNSLQLLSHISIVAILILLGALAALAYRTTVAPLRMKLGETKAVMERQEKLASLGVLAAGVAHEIRNPLTAIKFRLFSLKKSLPTTYANHEDVAVIRAEIDRLEKIVKDFLLFARPSDPELRVLPANELLREVSTLLKGQLQSQGITLKIDRADSAFVRADKNQLQQVLINLAQNAADSIEANGEITLCARTDIADLSRPERANGESGQHDEVRLTRVPVVVFEVADTGKGIPPEIESRIFDPFFSTKDGGTGLGLPIAARIIEHHGGYIQCQSRPGRGTIFCAVLPRVEEEKVQRFAHDGHTNSHH